MTSARYPVPGWAGEYEYDSDLNVYSIEREITRSDGGRYPVKACRRRWVIDKDGLAHIEVSRGGKRTHIWRHWLAQDLFSRRERERDG